jgi:membrane-anchored protein YejM (alkaline phosphatase superfamily)
MTQQVFDDRGERRSTRRELWVWTGWFYVGNVLILLPLSLRFLSAHDASDDALARLFTPLMIVAHFAVLAALVALVTGVTVLLTRRRSIVAIAAVTAASTLVAGVLIDSVVFQQYRFHINGAILNLLTGGAASETFVFPTTMYLQAALALVLIIAVEWTVAKFVTRWIAFERRAGGRAFATVLIVVFLTAHALHAWADAVSYTPITRQRKLLPAFHGLTAKSQLLKLGLVSPESRIDVAGRKEDSDLAYPLAPIACTPSSKPNIIFIVVDSWRFDALHPAVTPNMASFAPRTMLFADHLSGGSATRTGMFTLFYGIPATYWHDFLGEERGPVFVSELLRQQYAVEVFRSAPLSSPEFHRTIFRDVEGVRLESDGRTPAERDRDLTVDFIRFLNGRDEKRPFFSLLFYDSPHAYDFLPGSPQPFQPSWEEVNYFQLSNSFDPTPFRNRYLNSVHYVDSLVGKALSAIESKGLLENTIVVITGDHGQEFNETRLNYWGHNSNFSHFQTKVPMLVYWPGRSPSRFDHRTSHFDVVPTLMRHALGCSTDFKAYSAGGDLFKAGERDELLLSNFNDFAIVEPTRITSVSQHGTVEVVDPMYREMGVEPDPATMLAAMKLQSRFYKR